MRFGGDQPEHVLRAQQARRALADRRQGAREAFWDLIKDDTAKALDDALDTAIRVRVTPEIAEVAYEQWMTTALSGGPFGEQISREDRVKLMVEAAFAAAGFMVEE